MKKKIIIIIITIFVIIAGSTAGLYIVPNFHMIKVKDLKNGVLYEVYADHAEAKSGTDWYGTSNEWGISNRKHVEIKEKILGRPVTHIKGCCFTGNKTVENVFISDTVETIGTSAFNDCISLKNVSVGKNVISLGQGAFCNCEALETIELNEGLEYIGVVAFMGCESLRAINIPASVKMIDSSAFMDLGIEEVTFVGTVEHIACAAFSETPWIEQQGDYAIYNGMLLEYQGKSPVSVVPEGVRIISGAYRRDGVTDIYLPTSLEKILTGSFVQDAAVRIYIPAEVKNIEFEDEEAMFDVEHTTIVTTKDSYAESLAAEYGMACEIVDEIVYPE